MTVVQALDTIQVPFSRLLTPVLPDFLAAALTHLTTLFPAYQHYYVLAEGTVPPPSEATGGESTELSQLFCSLCDFVAGAARHARGREFWTEESVGRLVLALVQWVQITKDDVRCHSLIMDSVFIAGGRVWLGRRMDEQRQRVRRTGSGGGHVV